MEEGSFRRLFQSSLGGVAIKKNATGASRSTAVAIMEGCTSSRGTTSCLPLREPLPAT